MFKYLIAISAFSVFVLASAHPSLARTSHYSLDQANSDVGFAWNFGKDRVTGHMPVASADLMLDFSNVSRSKVSVAVDASGAEAGFPFASQAMKGPKVLDTATYPLITFRSTKVTKTGETARIDGEITIRGVTRPAVLTARLTRPAGTAAGDNSNLTIHLSGSVNRSDFGADGWADMVSDTVELNILAKINEVN